MIKMLILGFMFYIIMYLQMSASIICHNICGGPDIYLTLGKQYSNVYNCVLWRSRAGGTGLISAGGSSVVDDMLL